MVRDTYFMLSYATFKKQNKWTRFHGIVLATNSISLKVAITFLLIPFFLSTHQVHGRHFKSLSLSFKLTGFHRAPRWDFFNLLFDEAHRREFAKKKSIEIMSCDEWVCVYHFLKSEWVWFRTHTIYFRGETRQDFNVPISEFSDVDSSERVIIAVKCFCVVKLIWGRFFRTLLLGSMTGLFLGDFRKLCDV